MKMNLRLPLLACCFSMNLVVPSVSLADDVDFGRDAAFSAEPKSETAREFHRHLYLEIGTKYVEFDIDFDDRMTEFSPGFSFEEEGRGLQIALGYAPDPDFCFQVDFSAGEVETVPSDATGAFAMAGLGVQVPLVRWSVTELALFAGFGGNVLFFDHDTFQSRVYLGGYGETGLSLRLHLSRRVALQARATHAVNSIAREVLSTDGQDDDLRVVGGSAWYRIFGTGLVFTF